MIEGVDYSYGRPDPAGLYAAGKRFACRYLTVVNDVTRKKLLTKGEADALIAAGVAVVSNWEYAAGDARGGRGAGIKYANLADAQHRAAGGPPDRPIYFSVDWDATAADLAGPVRGYFQGIASVIGAARVGAYGGIRTIDYLFDHGLIAWGWQTYAWSNNQWDNRAHIYQYHNGATVAGADCDLDLVVADDYGQWGVDDMATPEETAKAVWNQDQIPAPRPPYADPDYATNPTWQADNTLRVIVEEGRKRDAAIALLTKKVNDLEKTVADLASQPLHEIKIDAAVLHEALFDPAYLEVVARAVAGELGGRLDA